MRSKIKKALPAAALSLCILLSGCDSLAVSASAETGSTLSGSTAEDMFSSRDYETGYNEDESAVIKLNGDSASCSSGTVYISGSTVTIKDEGTYVISGTLDDGTIIIDAEDTDKIQLVLDDVSINSETSAAIYVKKADKVFVTMAEGSDNSLSNTGIFASVDENNVDAAVFSKADITFNGSGTLNVSSPGGHGVVSKDELVITSGSYVIEAGSQGMSANDSISIVNADVSIVSDGDGIHAENTDDKTSGIVYIGSGTFKIKARGDGISASGYVQIEDGTFDIVSGGGSANAEQKTSGGNGRVGSGGFRNDGQGMDGQGSGRKNGNAQSESGSGGFGPGQGHFGGHGGKGRLENDSESSGGNMGLGPNGEISGGATQSSNYASPTLRLTASVSDASGTTAGGDRGNIQRVQNSGNADGGSSGKAIKAEGNLIIDGGDFSMDSADDAVHSCASAEINGGTFDIATGDDAFHAKDKIAVNGGTLRISHCYEGVEGMQVEITGGTVTIAADDDGLNACGGADMSGFGGLRGGDSFQSAASDSSSIVISGGTINITASGDGIDSNGSLEITGGYTVICGPTQGDTATLDYNTTGVISGGTFIGTGAAGMAQTLNGSGQGVVSAVISGQAGSKITLSDNKGIDIVSAEPELPYEVVIISSPEIDKGEEYTVTAGSSSAELTAA